MANNKGYRFDFASNTFYMNYKFYKKASTDVFSEEYEIHQKIKQDHPNVKTVVRAGRKQTTCNASKRLTYANMEEYISAQPNADELMAYFVIAQKESKKENSPYAFVRDWFVKQFPNYRECKVFEREKIVPFDNAATQENDVA